MQEQIDLWLNALTEKSNADYPVQGREIKYVLDPGRKYIRVVRQETWTDTQIKGRVSDSVHAFIEASTGDIYKAAGWKAPAKNGARFNVMNDIAALIQVCDPYGSYLYKIR